MKMKTHLAFAALLFLSSPAFAQHATGYMPLPEGKYEETRIPFHSTKNAAVLPKSYVISDAYFPTPGDQGNLGSCVGWSTGYAFASFYFSAKNQWGKPADYSKVMSPAYVYNGIRECNCGPDCGSYIADALELMKTKGVVPWEYMPYSDKDCSKPMDDEFSVASNYKIKGYNRLANKMNFNEYKQYLSNDVPVIIGVPLGAGFDNIKSGSTSTFKCTQVEDGGHAMLVVGYDDTKQAFKIMNSWGKNWGDKGHVWVDYDCFKLMMGGNGGEAYVVSKDYELNNGGTPVVNPEDNLNPSVTVTADQFTPFGYSEELGADHYYVAYGFEISDEVLDQVSKVVYVFDNPDFADKYVTSTEAPYFATAYEGPYCLEEVLAIVYLKNGNTVKLSFDGCALLDLGEEDDYYDDDEEYYYYDDDEYSDEEYEEEYIEIVPSVAASSSSSNPGSYLFEVRLLGLSTIKDRVEKVVYDYNHESFSNRYVTVTSSSDSYKVSYTGWGCLTALLATVYFDDGSTQTLTIDMCEILGW